MEKKISAKLANKIASDFPKYNEVMNNIYGSILENAEYGSKVLRYILDRPLDKDCFAKVSGELYNEGYGVSNLIMIDSIFVSEFNIYYLK